MNKFGEQLSSIRLSLKVVELSDLGNIHELLSYKEVDLYNALGIPTNKQVTQVYLEEWMDQYKWQSSYVYTMHKKTEKREFVGLIALRLGEAKYKIGTVWYKLLPQYWSKGFSTEALSALLQFGFEELELHRIEAGCAVANVASEKVLLKNNFIFEGVKRKVLPLCDGWSDAKQFAILETDWHKLHS